MEHLQILLEEYKNTDAKNDRLGLAAKICVIAAYIKRYGNLVLLGESRKEVPVQELIKALEESLKNLELTGAECGIIGTSEAEIPIRIAIEAYKFFERVVETVLIRIDCLWVNLRVKNRELIVCMELESKADLFALLDFSEIRFEDGVWRVINCYPMGECFFSEAGDDNIDAEPTFSDVTDPYENQRELLAVKTRFHGQMGENLTMMRQAFTMSGTEVLWENAVNSMKKTVSFLKDGSELEDESGFEEFLRIADSCGVKVCVEGNLPGSRRIREVFVMAMRESLTNCVRHGEADEMHIVLLRENGEEVCSITNNGTLPDREIVPQGGLCNLKHYTEACGGRIELSYEELFTLIIMIPAEKEKVYEQGVDC